MLVVQKDNSMISVLILITAIVLGVAGEESQKFKVTTKKVDDTIEVRAEKHGTIFSVKSPFGIGQAVIERNEEKWPDAVTLRLHLKGLENFRASNGKIILDAAVSSQNGSVRLWKDGDENAPLNAKSPLWMEIRMVGGDGKATKEIPLKAGYFEMRLPKAFFEGNPKSITLNWIDFYRN
jgi:hypothetical protein